MMFALDFVLGLILGAAITALAAMALFSYREYQRETAAEIEKLSIGASGTLLSRKGKMPSMKSSLRFVW